MIKQYIKQALRMIGGEQAVERDLDTRYRLGHLHDHGDRHPVCREYGEFQAGGKPWPHLLHNDRHEQWQG